MTADDNDDDKSTKIWVENLRERDHLENLRVDGETNIKINVYEKGICGSLIVIWYEWLDETRTVLEVLVC